jgi:Fur family ferric uptake transcriptional regulator
MKQKEQKSRNHSWFQERGLRATKTRLLLLEVFQNTRGPQSVPELLEALARKSYTPHKTTLYREVEQLAEKGFLTRVQLSSERVSYELSGHHHHHFVCQLCNRITELSFCEDVMKKISRTLQSQGKRIKHHTFEFFGVCELCTY